MTNDLLKQFTDRLDRELDSLFDELAILKHRYLDSHEQSLKDSLRIEQMENDLFDLKDLIRGLTNEKDK